MEMYKNADKKQMTWVRLDLTLHVHEYKIDTFV
jgi:hypothetical protein